MFHKSFISISTAQAVQVVCRGILVHAMSACVVPLETSLVQIIQVVATDGSGTEFSELTCTLHNKGRWQVVVPGKVKVTRSEQPLQIECTDVQGVAAPQENAAAIDERKTRAKKVAKRYGVIGAGVSVGLLGAVAMTPAAILYVGAAGVGVGGLAAGPANHDGYSYPERIELRY